MARRVTSLPAAVVVCVAGLASPAVAQVTPALPALGQIAAAHGELQGVVTDDQGEPLAGAVVSALGATTAFAVTDRAGRFAFRTLPPGPYLVRAHLQGFVPARGRVIQVNAATRSISSLAMTRKGGPDAAPQILAAGVGVVDDPSLTTMPADDQDHDHSERAWRLRHLKRTVLKDAGTAIALGEDDDSFLVDSIVTIGRAVGQPARAAAALFADFSLSGQVNLLTTTSFDRPQDLFSTPAAPRGVTFVSLNSPTVGGDWNVRGAMTQGDVASWVLAGSYVRRAPAAHAFEAGLSYSMQRYDGGNPAALAAVTDGSRNAGEVYAYDSWTIVPAVSLQYGAKYARYDYLERDGLFSPRASVTVAPTDVLRLRVAASRRETAPGAEEFLPQASPAIWLPPERTFSPLSSRRGFRPERVTHVEIAAEHDMGGHVVIGVRSFRQHVTDQVVTLFGVSLPGRAVADLGHYYLGSAGDVAMRGWGVSMSRQAGSVRASLDYTRTGAQWVRRAPDWRLLEVAARSAYREGEETLHDLTAAVQTDIPVTATRVFVLYKLNGGFAASDPTTPDPRFGSRFDVQVTQALPFLDFSCAQWEMLLTVRNLFREDLLDASAYDELLVIKPPKRVVGGLTVRF